uniref:Tubby C-terminal domain-containing protein n=1 Tax=Oryza punctata TaxID=4537 RepID=A0A0E0KYM3_ORYPU
MALLDQAAAVAVAAPRANKRAKVAAEEEEYEPCRSPAAAKKVARLTVWCKSLVFHGEGYAVFDDADGRMVFRVDSYYAGRRSMALMDHAGRVLLTVRRRHCRVLSLTETWEVYKGDVDDDGATCSLHDATDGQDEPPHLMMRATKDLGNPSCTVSMLAAGAGNSDEPACGHGLYRMSWSRREEWSRVHCSRGCINSLIAEVRRKRGGPRKTTLLGKDVLSLTVQPGMDQAVAMAMLMISNSYR